MSFHRRTSDRAIGFLLLALACTTVFLTQELMTSAVVSLPSALKSPSNATPRELTNLRRAIIGQESGADFRAVNPHSGALGYGQIMPDNLPKWSEEALGRTVSRSEFLNDPDLQLTIIDYKLSQYWQKSQAASKNNEDITVLRVAAWWYSGKPDLYTSTQTQFYAGYRYPSIAEYSLSVLRRYQALDAAT